MTLATAIYSLIKLSPALINLLSSVMDLYYQEMDRAQDRRDAETQSARDVLVASLKKPGLSDEERAQIRRKLYDLHKR